MKKNGFIPIGPFILVPLGVFILLLIVSVILFFTQTRLPRGIKKILPSTTPGKEPFCASTATGACRGTGEMIDDTTTDCSANRRDFTLGYRGSPMDKDCAENISPQWTYWYYPNIFDHPCTDYDSPTTEKQCVASRPFVCHRPTTDEPVIPDQPFLFDPLPPARPDCPIDPIPPYQPIGTRHLTFPNPF